MKLYNLRIIPTLEGFPQKSVPQLKYPFDFSGIFTPEKSKASLIGKASFAAS
jgi:hypothetical protein